MINKSRKEMIKSEQDLPRVFNQVAISNDGSMRVATQVI